MHTLSTNQPRVCVHTPQALPQRMRVRPKHRLTDLPGFVSATIVKQYNCVVFALPYLMQVFGCEEGRKRMGPVTQPEDLQRMFATSPVAHVHKVKVGRMRATFAVRARAHTACHTVKAGRVLATFVCHARAHSRGWPHVCYLCLSRTCAQWR